MGIVSGIIQGERAAKQDAQDKADRQWTQDQRKFKSKREKVDASHSDTKYQEGQQDRQHMLKRRPVVEQQHDQAAADKHQARQAGVKATDQQIADDKAQSRQSAIRFGWQVHNHNITQPTKDMQASIAEDQAKTAVRVQKAQKTYDGAVKKFEASQDPRVFAKWYNDNVAQNGNLITMHQDGQGNWWVDDSMGHSNKIGSAEDVMRYAHALTDPSVFEQFANHEHAAAVQHQRDIMKHPKDVQRVVGPDGYLYDYYLDSEKSVPITDSKGRQVKARDNEGMAGGKAPARLQEVRAVEQNLPAIKGETPRQRYMRAWNIVTQRSHLSPTQQKQLVWRQAYSSYWRAHPMSGTKAEAEKSADGAVMSYGQHFGEPTGGESATGLNGGSRGKKNPAGKGQPKQSSSQQYQEGQPVTYDGSPYWYTSKGLVPRKSGESFDQALANAKKQQ